jgi:ferric-dicitrate binding protein FerR (iron transport regulator)
MKTSLTMLKFSVAMVALIAFGTVALAQNRERFGISAKAGGVNAVTGKVSVKSEGKAVRLLTSNDDLESGDVVSTSVSGQVEVLLNPGTYLRLAERSEFVMEDTSLDNLLVRLNKGSAIIEATGPGEAQLYIPIVTPQQRMTIVRPGVCRINAAPGATELFVHKGRVSLSDNKNDVVKGGKKVSFTGAPPTIAKLTDEDKDEFDEWSKTRGQTLAKANARLSARTVNAYLTANSWFGGSAFSSRFGLWTWSPFSSCYTFLPFSYGWGSPYGGYYGAFYSMYGNGYYNHQGPYSNPNVITTNNGNNGSGSGYPGGGGSSGGWGTGGSGGSGGGVPGGGSSGGGSISAPAPTAHPNAGPRDPDGGGRSINAIKNPIN